jgi:hypothetical protein
MRFEIGAGQAAEADGLAGGLEFERVKAEAGFGNQLLKVVEERVGIGPIPANGKNRITVSSELIS